MILFLTSNIGGIKKENGKKILVKLFEKNDFLNNLKSNLRETKKFVLIASNPDEYEKNDLFLKMDIEALKLSGLEFQDSAILDGRNIENPELVLENANLIFLSGGNTLIQNKFFNKINLKKYLKNTDSVIVGISAGSINSAKNVFNSPEEEQDLKNSSYMQGLELTNINVEPHFDINNASKIQMDSILFESNKRTIYGLTDGAYIIKINNKYKIYGESYKIHDGIITKICTDNNSQNIDID